MASAFIALIALVISVWLLFQDSWVQSFTARVTAHELSIVLGTTVRISGLSISCNNGVQLTEVLVKDSRDTTLFAAQMIGVKPLWFSRSKHFIRIASVHIRDAQFQLLKHKGDSLLNLEFIINAFSSPDTSPPAPDTVQFKPWTIMCDQVDLRGVRFHYQDCNDPEEPYGMDYSNIDVGAIDLDIRDALIEGDTINATIRSLSAEERSGFRLKKFHGICRVSPRFIHVEDLTILTDHSALSLDFAFNYDSFKSFNDFINRVSIEAKIHPSSLDFTDIGFFAPAIREMTNRFRIQGRVDGPVSRLKATGFRAEFGTGSVFDGDIFALGLPDVESTYTNATIRQCVTNPADLASFKLPGMPDGIQTPSIVSILGSLDIRGDFCGFYNDFTARATVLTGIGSVGTNLSLKKPVGVSLYDYKGSVAVKSLDLGKLTGNPELLGKVSLHANIDGQGFSLREVDLLMQMEVDSIEVNRYNYQNVSINGSLFHGKFFGDVGVNDPNLLFSFTGMANFQDSIPVFHFNAHLKHAQLYDLHLLDRDTTMALSLSIQADAEGNSIDNLLGNLIFSGISYQEGNLYAELDSLVVKTDMDSGGQKKYVIRSDAVDADFTGAFTFSQLIPSLGNFIRNYLANFNLRPDSTLKIEVGNEEFHYSIRFKDTRDVTAIFAPFLTISPGSFITGNYNEQQQLLSLSGHSSLLHVYGMDLMNWKIEAETRTSELGLQVGCDQLVMNKTNKNDSVYIQIDTLLLAASIRDDSILYTLSSTSSVDYSYITGYLTFLEEGVIKTSQTELDITIAGHTWAISPDNFVLIAKDWIKINDLTFQGKDQLLSINGLLSHEVEDTLDLKFENLDISELDYFLENPTINIDGVLSGSLKITDLYNEFSLFSNLKIKNFTFNKQLLGDAMIYVDYNNQANRFDVLSEIIYTGNIGQNIPFSLQGSYFIADADSYFDFDLKLKNLNLKILQPFVSSFMSKLTGLASGEVKITGTLKTPSFEGELNLMRTEINISYLNVPYSFSDIIEIKPDKILFNNILIYDSIGNKAYLNGSVNHDFFKNIFIDLTLSMSDFSAFRNTYAQNPIFYGKARASGTVGIRGPPDKIKISVDVATGSNTMVNIPISLTQSVGQVDYILFASPDADSLARQASVTRSRDATGLSLDMKINVRPDAQVEVIFPDQLGNIKATGSGDIRMGMTPTTAFNLNGRYAINKGSFVFQMRNLIRMPFAIKEGSLISWTGDPADANISLSAIYKTKVPLTGLTTETESLSGRIPVECVIRLNGKLMNPTMSFGLALPNAQEQVKTIVYNAIDTNNANEMTQQVLYILVMNQFKPVVASSDPTVDVGATSLAIVTNQISSWLSGMSQNLNIGLNYKPGSSTAGQEIDMTLSTQLFNDRLLIDGTFGMSSYRNPSSSQASTIVGDINIEYLLTKNRRWRLRAFNRTNTIDVLYNNSPYTQGVGISYQRDFWRWGDLFKKSKTN